MSIDDEHANKKVKVTTEHAYELLKEMIFDRYLAPGQKINIDQLARDLKISAIPIREALSRLHSDKLVTSEPFKGYRVNEILNANELVDLLNARLMMEIYAAQRIIRYDKRQAVERMKWINEEVTHVKVDVSYRKHHEFIRLDQLFHSTLVESADNLFLLEAYNGMHCHLHLARLYHSRGEVDQQEAVIEHNRILEALETRDLYLTELELARHLEGVKARLAKNSNGEIRK